MPEPTISSSAGAGLVKLYGLPAIGGVIAVIVGFLIIMPRTVQEAMARIVSTLVVSMIFAKPLFFYLSENYAFVALHASDLELPIYVSAGLPAWWVLGFVVRTLDSKGDKILSNLFKFIPKDKE